MKNQKDSIASVRLNPKDVLNTERFLAWYEQAEEDEKPSLLAEFERTACLFNGKHNLNLN